MALRLIGAGAASLALLATGAGCSDEEPETTPQALAWIAADYTGVPDTAGVKGFGVVEEFEGRSVAVDLRYQPGGFDQGDMVEVVVGERFEATHYLSCDQLGWESCEDLEGGGTLVWSLLDPEEDPGYVQVFMPKGDDTTVVVSYGGPEMPQDPRTMDLPISVDTLIALARDERLDLTTSEAAVEHGGDLDYWEP